MMPDQIPGYMDDDEDGFPWDFDRYGDLGNYDDEE